MQNNVVRTVTVRGQSQGLDKVKADLEGVSSAQQKVGQTGEGMGQATERAAKRQLSAASNYDRMYERIDRLARITREYGRDLSIAERALNTGHISTERHAQTVAMLQQRYERLTVAEQGSRTQMTATTMAIDQQAGATMRLAAANDNLGGSTANIAAQFQDIGVTAAMGMNPVMIALQQGTQLSAVLNTMQNPVKGLGMALLSIVNPVSLATIGFVALTAAAIQFFTASNDNAKDATDALERHNEWLDKTLTGYEKIRDAADEVLEAASRMPEGVVVSDLKAGLQEQEEAAKRVEAQIVRNNSRLAETVTFLEQLRDAGRAAGDEGSPDVEAVIRAIELLSKLTVGVESTRKELDAAADAAARFIDSTEDEALKQLGRDALALVQQLMQVSAQADSTAEALRNIPNEIRIQISMRQTFDEAMGEIGDLYMDPRSRFDVARENLDAWALQAKGTAQTYSELVGFAGEYQRVLDSINAAEAKANEKSGAGRAREAEKLQRSYADLVRDSRQFIAEQELEVAALGLSAEATARLRFEQEMLNKAANDNIALTPEQRDEIGSLALEMASAEERTRRLAESYNLGRDTFKGFFADLRSNLREGMGLWDAFADAGGKALDRLLDRALDTAADQVWSALWKGLSGGLGGGATGGTWGNGLWGSAIFNAKGNIYSSPSLSSYSNQIHDTPRLFNFANGIGQFAEAGPEAIMPLGRDGHGRLGVRVAEQAASSATGGFSVTVINQGQPAAVQSVRQTKDEKGGVGLEVTLKPVVEGMIKESIAGGRMDGVMEAVYGVKRVPR